MRIAELREKANLTQIQVANDLGIGRTAFSNYETEKRQPDYDTLCRIADYFGVTVDYILGRGEGNTAPLREPLTVGAMVPVLGKVPAGVPIEAVEDIIDEIDISEKLASDEYDYFGLLVTGASMSPEYLDGDIVIVRKQNTADTGDDVVAYVNGYDATIKRLVKSTRGITLRALNPAYETKTYTNKEISDLPVSIAGVVVEQRRRRK